ncbi:copper amine oxidase [Lophiotrema nucula]|uniref:Copper amine oxidase n=1 Tax=Lophiotrema nucula TaxID=690887 RepID=A0A6A5ZJM8_9PLEO|nr:copper amine oxidase [Lophiotrema nucula]
MASLFTTFASKDNVSFTNSPFKRPCFRLYPSLGSPIHLTFNDSSGYSKRMNWAIHHLYVLQRKDSEPNSTYDDFNTHFDGDCLEQEDLVVYFNLGMHHMPDTYDLPNTVLQGVQSGITIRPQNYGKYNAAQDTRQQVHIEYGEAERYGVELPHGSFDLDGTSSIFEA